MLCLLVVAAVNGYAADDTSLINIYDQNGNLVTGDGRYYEYNDANQLVKVRQGEDATGPVVAEYFYDSAGQRVKKIENGVVSYYIGRHYEKQVGGSDAGSTSYYFGEGGERLAKKDPKGDVYYYHLDHLDGVNAVTKGTDGTVVARADYLPFGEVRAGSSGTEKYTYTGKEQDKTGLYYFEARYNSSEFRHFTQADIADPDYGDPQDLNRYAYVGNNPLSYVDYDGFKKKKKKKAKLSKREKWMIAHGTDPDHDKTTLKKAKKQFEAGVKYTTANNSQSGAGYSLTASNPPSLLDRDSNSLESYSARLSAGEKQQLLSQQQYSLAQAAFWSSYAGGLSDTIGIVENIKFVADSLMGFGSVLVPGAKSYFAATNMIEGADLLYRSSHNTLSNEEAIESAGKMLINLGFESVNSSYKIIDLGIEGTSQVVGLWYKYSTDNN
jgi:RHS repeat-associated protein